MAGPTKERSISEGKIVTFYSFEGGVGSSTMASRVGGLLASEGKRVALIDFDLNAPGLSFLLNHTAEVASRGISGFYADTWSAQAVPPVEPYLASIATEHWRRNGTSTGRLDFMPAYSVSFGDPESALRKTVDLFETISREDPDAANKLATNASLAKQLRMSYDFTLIDLPSGFNNVAGLPMRQMADLAVVLLRPDSKGIAGTKQVLSQLKSIYPGDGGSEGAEVPRVIVATQVTEEFKPEQLRNRLGLSADSEIHSIPLDLTLLIDDNPFLKGFTDGLNPATSQAYEAVARRLLA